MRSSEVVSKDVWASIAAEIDKGGIPIELIKKRRDAIAQYIIQDLGEEIQRERGTESNIKIRKAAKTAKRAQKQATIPKTNDASTLDLTYFPALLQVTPEESKLAETCKVETEAAEFGILGESAANSTDGNTETTLRSSKDSLTAIDDHTSKDLQYSASMMPHPKKDADLEPTPAPQDQYPNVVDPNHKRQQNGECGPSEPGSLISKLEAVKRHSDVKTALKGKGFGSARPGPGVSGAVVAQFEDAELQKSAQDVAILEDKFGSDQLGHAKAKFLEEDITTLECIEPANQKLRAMLSSLQGPEAVNADYLEYKLGVVDGESQGVNQSQKLLFKSVSDASSIIVAAQPRTIVKGGRWFETSGGSLMRIEDEDALDNNLYDQQRISEQRNYVSKQNGRSYEISVANRGDEISAETSNFESILISHGQSKSVNVFQAPDNDKDDEEYDAAVWTKTDNDREQDELEDGEINEGAPRPVDGMTFHEDKGFRSEIASEEDSTSEPEEGDIGDSGNFTTYDVCVALGNGNLDEQRMRRLEEGFMALLDDAVGRYGC